MQNKLQLNMLIKVRYRDYEKYSLKICISRKINNKIIYEGFIKNNFATYN